MNRFCSIEIHGLVVFHSTVRVDRSVFLKHSFFMPSLIKLNLKILKSTGLVAQSIRLVAQSTGLVALSHSFSMVSLCIELNS
jgi:hypothetical protein